MNRERGGGGVLQRAAAMYFLGSGPNVVLSCVFHDQWTPAKLEGGKPFLLRWYRKKPPKRGRLVRPGIFEQCGKILSVKIVS